MKSRSVATLFVGALLLTLLATAVLAESADFIFTAGRKKRNNGKIIDIEASAKRFFAT